MDNIGHKTQNKDKQNKKNTPQETMTDFVRWLKNSAIIKFSIKTFPDV